MKGGVGGPCCHCGATSSPCWRKGPAEKPILCNACGARYLVKRSLDGYMPGQKPSKFATTSPACAAPGDVQQQKPGPKRGVGDGSSRKRRVVDRYDLEDLYHCGTNTKRARGRASQPVAPVSINVTAGLGGLVQTSISLWKPADTFTTGVHRRASDAAPSLQTFFSYPASKAHLQMDSEAVVLASALALLRQPNGSSDSSSSGSSSCHSSSSSRSPSPAADDFPRRRRKQQHPTAGAAS